MTLEEIKDQFRTRLTELITEAQLAGLNTQVIDAINTNLGAELSLSQLLDKLTKMVSDSYLLCSPQIARSFRQDDSKKLADLKTKLLCLITIEYSASKIVKLQESNPSSQLQSSRNRVHTNSLPTSTSVDVTRIAALESQLQLAQQDKINIQKTLEFQITTLTQEKQFSDKAHTQELVALQASLAESQRQQELLSSQIQNSNTKMFSENSLQLATLQQQILSHQQTIHKLQLSQQELKAQELKSLNGASIQEGKIVELTQKLSEKESLILALEKRIATKESLVEASSQQLKTLQCQFQESHTTISRLEEEVQKWKLKNAELKLAKSQKLPTASKPAESLPSTEQGETKRHLTIEDSSLPSSPSKKLRHDPHESEQFPIPTKDDNFLSTAPLTANALQGLHRQGTFSLPRGDEGSVISAGTKGTGVTQGTTYTMKSSATRIGKAAFSREEDKATENSLKQMVGGVIFNAIICCTNFIEKYKHDLSMADVCNGARKFIADLILRKASSLLDIISQSQAMKNIKTHEVEKEELKTTIMRCEDNPPRQEMESEEKNKIFNLLKSAPSFFKENENKDLQRYFESLRKELRTSKSSASTPRL
jgi:hypothetical protein